MDIKELTQHMQAFVESKGWYAVGSKHPQSPRNLSISLALVQRENHPNNH